MKLSSVSGGVLKTSIFKSTFLLRNDTDELIELATAKKTRDQQREKFRQINHKIATLKYSGGVLQ